MGLKTGKEIKILCSNKNIKCSCGAISGYKSPKSVYIYISTWVLPKKKESYNKIIISFERKIKKLIRENNLIDIKIFDEYYILDMDLRSSGVRMEKRSFMSLELNLYQKGPEHSYLPLLSNNNTNVLIPHLTNLVNNITFSDLFVNNEYFDFYLTKKLKNNMEKQKEITNEEEKINEIKKFIKKYLFIMEEENTNDIKIPFDQVAKLINSYHKNNI